MKNYILFIMMTLISGCITSVEVGPGQEAVLIMKPLLFGHGGIDPTPVKTGMDFIASTTDAIMVDMQPRQYEQNFDDMMSSDGVPLDFHAILRIQVVDSVQLISKFGEKWYEKNLQAEFQSAVRQAVKKHGMNETAIQSSAVDQIDAEVFEALTTKIKEKGIPAVLLDITVGKANPPDSIKNQRIATAAEQQRVITETQRKLAEDARLQAEMSRAAADNAYREAMKLSPEQYLQLEEIKMKNSVCGGGKCTFFFGSSGVNLTRSVN